MATYKKGHDALLSRYNAKRKELAASMLEYSEHMRHINRARGAHRHRDNDPEPPFGLEIRAHKQSLYSPDSLRHSNRRSNHYHTDSHRLERPLSFNEKEFARDRYAEYERPWRDTKSERPVISIPSADQDIPDTPEDTKHVKISFVNASDLYDLVEPDDQTQNANRNSAQIANVEDGIQLIQDIELSSRNKRDEQDRFLFRRQAGTREMEEPSRLNQVISTRIKNERTLSVDDNSGLLTGRAIKKDFTRVKYRPKSDSAAQHSNDNGNCETIPTDSKIAREQYDLADDNEHPLDILLKQAASQHTASAGNGRLPLRPKRAKRMMLHQPELLAIPEDGGSFIHPDSDHLESARRQMLSSSVPVPSNSSLQALMSVTAQSRRQDIAEEGDYIIRKPKKSRDPYIELDNRKMEKPRRKSRSDLNMEQLMTTSVYSALPWETEAGRDFRTFHETRDRNSHKQRAQKKMKRLIFLRDQPDQHYRREM